MLWVYAIPPWWLFAGVIGFTCGLAMLGLLLFHRAFPPREELTHNDVAGPVIGTVGTILAVILSFLLVTVWQEYDQAAGTVEQEASAVADLYHLAGSFPPAVGQRLRSDLRDYIEAVVNDEWPAMRTGHRSSAARRSAMQALEIVAAYNPSAASQQALQQDAIGLVHTFQDARRDRLFANDQGIPVFFWASNLVMAAITIALCYLFRVRSRTAHVAMTMSVAAVIAIVFVLIALFDYPFRGYTQIKPTLFVNLQHSLGNNLTESD